ncbi:ATP-binding cassette domain-containing protein [Streptomyces cyaneochromogenes]|uniref:ATP-binding cassette domain-containing protein n=1 Tax=Streptomyces cyaneochromogenes TaxID=2496836 RepID=A0A3Q9F049_9ACTN|nr:ATP-binding cassette domain-containing protein [Streptomyces cyaneochromogenes]AZQ40176.1 ATP-binding cassette domain-containing protein [Streptomyces cyaneochromogenes]
MIETEELSRSYGSTRALDGVSFRMGQGKVLCLLGHNGAGKSTLVSILATALPPTQGVARVAGYDVVRQAREVRRRIGLTGQFAAVDGSLSGRDNLVLVARLLGARRAEARTRAGELLDAFALTGAADRAASTYSGGMRRRLDLASSFVGHPRVLFLDEPTTGLDPVSRGALWEMVRSAVAGGTTVLLTTQYLEEAEQLADRVIVLGHGRIIADGSVAQLKEQLGVSTVRATLADPASRPAALAALHRAGLEPQPGEPAGTVVAPVRESAALAAVVRALDEAGVAITGIALSEPTLDDVYVSLAERLPELPVLS